MEKIKHIGKPGDSYNSPYLDECAFQDGEVINRTYYVTCCNCKNFKNEICPSCNNTGEMPVVSTWSFVLKGPIFSIPIYNRICDFHLDLKLNDGVQEKITVPIFQKLTKVGNKTFQFIYRCREVIWKTRQVIFELEDIIEET